MDDPGSPISTQQGKVCKGVFEAPRVEQDVEGVEYIHYLAYSTGARHGDANELTVNNNIEIELWGYLAVICACCGFVQRTNLGSPDMVSRLFPNNIGPTGPRFSSALQAAYLPLAFPFLRPTSTTTRISFGT